MSMIYECIAESIPLGSKKSLSKRNKFRAPFTDATRFCA